MYLKAGDLVVCINARPNANGQPNPLALEKLQKGKFYRVARYHPVPAARVYWRAKPMAGVELVGVDHSPGHGWQAWRFRKVVPAEASFIATIRQSAHQKALL